MFIEIERERERENVACIIVRASTVYKSAKERKQEKYIEGKKTATAISLSNTIYLFVVETNVQWFIAY